MAEEAAPARRPRKAGTAGAPAAKRTRAAGSSGKTLEKLVAASSGPVVCLTQIPNGIQFKPRGEFFFKPSPPDFAGTVCASGRSVWLDCKEERNRTSFNAQDDHVKPHQVETLVAHGRAGAVSGLLIRQVHGERLRWLDWKRLEHKAASYPWDDLPDVGDATAAVVDWDLVLLASMRAGWSSDLAQAKGGAT